MASLRTCYTICNSQRDTALHTEPLWVMIYDIQINQQDQGSAMIFLHRAFKTTKPFNIQQFHIVCICRDWEIQDGIKCIFCPLCLSNFCAQLLPFCSSTCIYKENRHTAYPGLGGHLKNYVLGTKARVSLERSLTVDPFWVSLNIPIWISFLLSEKWIHFFIFWIHFLFLQPEFLPVKLMHFSLSFLHPTFINGS